MSRFDKNNIHKFGINHKGKLWKELDKLIEFKVDDTFQIEHILGITNQEHEQLNEQSTSGENPMIPKKQSNPKEYNEQFKREIKRLSFKDVAKKVSTDKKFSLNFD